MKRAASVFFAAIFLCAFAPASFAGDALRIASAGYGDLFWVMGKRLGEILGSDDVPAQNIATSGDEENIELLVSGKADVAFVSGEAIDRFISSGGSVESLRTIARVWPSAVHVLLRGDFVKTNTIADIDKKYIYIGEKGSVHRTVIEKILAAKGIKIKHLMRDINDATLLSIMRNFVERELDGAIIIGPALNQATDDIISKTGGTFQLIPLSEGDLAAIAGEKNHRDYAHHPRKYLFLPDGFAKHRGASELPRMSERSFGQ